MTAPPSWRYQTWSELTRDEVYAILSLRQRVFVVEHARVCLDADGDDQRASHLSCLGPVAVRITAQSYLARFYGAFGFVPISDELVIDGIPHLEMRLARTTARA